MQVADPSQYAVIAQRMQALEQQITSLGADKGNRAMAWILDLLKALVPGAVLAVIGFVLNDTVDHALKEHQLQIDAIKDMQSLSADLQKPDITRDEALARAAQLAAYGKYSTPFFINVLEIGNEYGGLGALQGLRMVARSEPEGVCQQAAAVIRNRTGLYGWQSHLAALQLLGEVRCVSASADVRDYQTSLTSLAILTTWVASPAPDQTEFDKLNLALQATVTRLSRPAPPPPSRGWFGQSH
jgi:hypothetical protein